MILVVALLIGGVAAFALYNYVNGVEDKALQGTEQVTVYWVQAPISANTQGEQVIGSKMIVTKQVPASVRPPSAITDLSTIKGKVAKTDLAVGQIVVPGMFVDQTQAVSTWTERLPVDRVAVQVSLDQTRGLVGMLQPGDHVTALLKIPCKQEAIIQRKDPEVACKGQEDMFEIRHLYSNLEVLNIGSGFANPVAGSDSKAAAAAPTASPIITFSVPLQAARRLIGTDTMIWLALEPKDFVPPPGSQQEVTDGGSLFAPGGIEQGPPPNYTPYKDKN
jgi:Flp pilus assembly protein CpaB